MPDLTPEQINELLKKLDTVCAQAKVLSDQLRAAMVQRARDDQQVFFPERPDKDSKPRKRR